MWEKKWHASLITSHLCARRHISESFGAPFCSPNDPTRNFPNEEYSSVHFGHFSIRALKLRMVTFLLYCTTLDSTVHCTACCLCCTVLYRWLRCRAPRLPRECRSSPDRSPLLSTSAATSGGGSN